MKDLLHVPSRISTALNSVFRLAYIPSYAYPKLEVHENESRLMGDLDPAMDSQKFTETYVVIPTTYLKELHAMPW